MGGTRRLYLNGATMATVSVSVVLGFYAPEPGEVGDEESLTFC